MINFFPKFLLNTIAVTILGYMVVTVRSGFNPLPYIELKGFLPIIGLTSMVFFIYNLTVQAMKYLWDKKGIATRSWIRKFGFYSGPLIAFTYLVLLFAYYSFLPDNITLWESGYLTLELPLFVALFIALPVVAIKFPETNPLEHFFPPSIDLVQDIVEVPVIELVYKTELVLLPIHEVILVWSVRRMSYVLAKDGRLMEKRNMIQADFHILGEQDFLIPISRTTSVNSAFIEGYDRVHSTICFVSEIQQVVDHSINDFEERTKKYKNEVGLEARHLKLTKKFRPWIIEFLRDSKRTELGIS